MINVKHTSGGAVRYRPSAALMARFAFAAWVDGQYKVMQDVPVTVRRRRTPCYIGEVHHVRAYP